MANDNTLGAPTEGLGQKVTFAFDTNSGTPQLQIADAGRISGGVRGGGTVGAGQTQATGVQTPPNPTLDLLMRVGDTVLAPHLARAKNAAYVAGMQKAMAGQAVTDIAAEQPWYSTLFGESDVVEGARAYAGHTIAQTQVAAMEDKMPELRKMDPQEAQAYFTDSVQKNLTGDAATDASVMRAMTSALPSVMRQQAKQHYGYLQERAAVAEGQAFDAGAARLQASAKGLADGYVTQEEHDALGQAFVRSLIPAAGRDEKNRRETLAQNLEKWAVKGQFHAIAAATKSGILDTLTPDQQMGVSAAVEKEEGRMRTRYSMDWAIEKAKIEAQAHMPVEGQVATRGAELALDMNARYQKLTGSTMGIFSPAEVTSMTKDSAIAITQEKNRQAALVQSNALKASTVAEKAAAVENKTNMILANITRLRDLEALPGYGKENITATVIPKYNEAVANGKGTEFLQMVFADKGYVLNTVADGSERAVEALVSGGDDTVKKYGAGAETAYADWKKMHDSSPMMAAAYYGKQAPRMAKMDQLMKAGLTPETAWTNAMLRPLHESPIHPDVMKAVIAEVTDQQPGWIMGTLSGRIPVNAEGQRMLSNAAAKYATQWSDSQTPANAGKIGLKLALSRGEATALGGYAWVKQPAQPDLAAYLSSTHDGKLAVPTDTASEVVQKAIDVALYGSGQTAGIVPNKGFHIRQTKADSVNVYQTQDGDGNPALHILASIDGDIKGTVIPFNRVFDLYHQHKEARAAQGVMRNGTNRQVLPFVGGDTREFPPTN